MILLEITFSSQLLNWSFSTAYASAAGNEHLKFGLQFEVNYALSFLSFTSARNEGKKNSKEEVLPVIFISDSNLYIFIDFEAIPSASINQYSSLRVTFLC